MYEFDRLTACLPSQERRLFDWTGLMQTPLASLFEKMRETPQNPAWHGEGDVLAHTRLVCDALAGMPAFLALPDRKRQELALAALLHDAGKIRCTREEDGILISPGHASEGARLTRSLLWRDFDLSGTSEKQNFRETVCLLIRYHTKPLHFLSDDNPELAVRRIAQNGLQAPDFTLSMLCTLAQADVLGRLCDDRSALEENAQLAALQSAEAGCADGPYPFPSSCTAHACLSGRNVWPQQELFDDSWGEVILMCGLPGTGKDTWIRRNHPEKPMVSLDNIRRRMNILPTEDQGKVVAAAIEEAKHLLRSKTPFIWNATSLIPAYRSKEIRLFESYGARVRIVFLETEWEENLRRNADRAYVVPEEVICDMLNRFIPPEAFEARNVDWIIT